MNYCRNQGVLLTVVVLGVLAYGQEVWAQVIDHSGGFTGQTDMTLNGTQNGTPSPVTVVGSNLRVTDAQATEARSAFHTAAVAVGNFNTTFTFHILTGSTGGTTGLADGFGFCIQGNAPTGLGAAGGLMAYGGNAQLNKSVFVKFDCYGGGGAYSTTGMYLDGADPSNTANDINLRNAPVIDFQSGHDFSCAMAYDGTTLTVTLKDLSNNNTATQTYPVDIPTHVGAATGFVGFCGGTGGLNAIQEVMTWTWNSVPPPTNLTATAGISRVTLNWTAVAGASGYNILRSGTMGGSVADPYVLIGSVTPGTTTTYVDTTAVFPNTYFYVVQSVAGTLTSNNSAEVSCSPLQPNISAAPTPITIAENGGTAIITVTLRVNPTSNVVVQMSASNAADLLLTTPGGAPQGTIQLTFTPGGALSQQVTVTAVDRHVEGAPIVDSIIFNSVTSLDTTNYPANYVPPPIPCTIIADLPGIIVNPSAGLSTVNGGPAITFTVQLTTIPVGTAVLNLSVSDPNIATVSPLQITNAAWNNPVTVTVTPLNANTQTTYIANYDIIITTAGSTDPAYASLADTLVPISTPTNLPPLQKVWGSGCGLTGGEVALPLGLLAFRRRRRSSFVAR